MARTLIKVVIPLLIVALGLGALKVMVSRKGKAQKEAPPPQVAYVEVQQLQRTSTPAYVHATGAVEAARQVVVTPQVAGEVVWMSPSLELGGRVSAGQVLLRIDPRDYELAVAQQRGNVRQAEVNLELEQGRGSVAAREWELLEGDRDPGDAPLALRAPQLEVAKLALKAARAGLQRAELALERTQLRAPFNAVVVAENAEQGQVVGAGSQVATLVGTDRVFVRISVPLFELAVLSAPCGGEPPSPARILQDLGTGRPAERQGVLHAVLGTLDPGTRTAQLLVAVDAPYATPDGAPALMPGSYVEVELAGRVLEEVLAVPRSAVRSGDSCWIVDADERLSRRPLDIAWRDPEHLLVRGQVEPGDRLVVSPIAMPVEGAKVAVVGADDPRVDGEAAEAEPAL